MRDLPAISTLLALAAESDDIPLVARCRAIAAREHAAGDTAYDALRARLQAWVGEGSEGLARLAAEIRAGRQDGEAVRAWLWDYCLLRLAENNPGFRLPETLGAAEGARGGRELIAGGERVAGEPAIDQSFGPRRQR
jgi:hypothetical protein